MSKKKLIITITSLCLVVVAAVAAVVGVVAASTQTVTSNVSVTYAATNVKAKINLVSRYQNDATWSTRTLQTANEVEFLATEGSTTKTSVASATPIALGTSGTDQTAANWIFERYVIYRFEFLNNYASEGEGRTMNVSLTYTPASVSQDSTNYILAVATKQSSERLTEATSSDPRTGYIPSKSTSAAGDGDTAFLDWAAVVANQESKTDYVEGTNSTQFSALTTTAVVVEDIPQAQYAYFYILVMIANPLADMKFSTSAANAFTFGLSINA
jgi:hypothetical protein